MNNSPTRPIFFACLIGTLCLYSAVSHLDNLRLERRTQNLLQQSQRLQKVLESISGQQTQLLVGSQAAEKQKESLQETLASLKKQNESLMFQFKKIEMQVAATKEEKAYLEEMLINKTKQIDILRGQNPQALYEPQPAAGEIQQQISVKEEELQKLNDQNRQLQDKLGRLYKTTNEKINEINVAKIALAETVSGAQQKIQDEWNTVNLGSVTTSAMPAGRQAMPAHQNDVEEIPAPHEPKAAGHVLAINNEHGFVVIDMGKVDNLPNDATLRVTKEDGTQIATISVLELRDVMAACNIKEVMADQRIEINDSVSLVR